MFASPRLDLALRSALRTALSPSGSSGSTWRLGSHAGRSSALGGAVVPPWVDQSPRRLFPHGNPRPTPRLTVATGSLATGTAHRPVAVPRGTTIDQLDQCAADRTHKQIVGTAQELSPGDALRGPVECAVEGEGERAQTGPTLSWCYCALPIPDLDVRSVPLKSVIEQASFCA